MTVQIYYHLSLRLLIGSQFYHHHKYHRIASFYIHSSALLLCFLRKMPGLKMLSIFNIHTVVCSAVYLFMYAFFFVNTIYTSR